MRKFGSIICGAVLAILMVAPSAFATQQSGSLVVTPTEGLADGDQVSFSASGLVGGFGVVSVLCVDSLLGPGAALADACSFEGRGSFQIGVPSSFSGSITAVRLLTVDGVVYDCVTDQCSVAVAVTRGVSADEPPTQLLSAPVSFLGEPAIKISPDMGLDDDDAVLKSMQLLLGSWGCHPIAVQTLEEAVTAFDTYNPDIVITDFRLANGITGEDIIFAIKQSNHCTHATSFVFLTADTTPQLFTATKAIRPLILHKPIDPKNLRQQLQQVLAK